MPLYERSIIKAVYLAQKYDGLVDCRDWECSKRTEYYEKQKIYDIICVGNESLEEIERRNELI